MNEEARWLSPPEPEPCQGCYWVTGRLQVCDGTCDGLTEANLQERRDAWMRQQERA
jgi:hypothetical protein